MPHANHRWRQHKNVLAASENIIAELLRTSEGHNKYLLALRQADQEFLRIIDHLTAVPTL